MSNTFDDLHFIRKDTVNVDMKNRDTVQIVRFLNDKNVYYGTFYGVIRSSNCELSNAKLTNCTLYDLSGNKIDLSSLPSHLKDIDDNLSDLNYYVSYLRSHMGQAERDISGIYGELTSINYDISVVNEDISNLYRLVNEISGTSLTGLDEEISARIEGDEYLNQRITYEISGIYDDLEEESRTRLEVDNLLTSMIDDEAKIRYQNDYALSGSLSYKIKKLYDDLCPILTADMETDYDHLLSAVLRIKETLGTLY